MEEIPPVTLAGRTALVTGGGRRIGAAICQALHEQSMRVAIHYRGSADEADALAATLNGVSPDSARTFQADLLDPGAPARLVDDVIGWSGSLDALVNNASTFYPTPIGEITDEAWTDLVGSNLRVPVFLSQAAAPHLQRTSGSIVNIVDIHATRPLRDHHVYGAAKAGLAMFTRSLAKDLAPDVRVNGVSPGAIAWPEDGMTEDVKSQIVGEIPLGRTGSPQDIANAVVFLVRDATYSSGQIMAIDGGRSIGW